MSSSDLLDSAKGNQLESGEATFTKINDDVNVKPNVKLIGLTKEQLEQYRNDPFWKAVRYIMFALFWLVWLAMFVGAILIVILSPKCSKTGVKCDGNLINYRIFTPALRDSNGDGIGDFKGIQEKLSSLRGVGISGISPTPIFQTDSLDFAPETVVDIDTIDSRLGTEDDLKALIDEAHKSGLCFIADVPLSVSAKNKWALDTNDAVLETKGSSVVLQLGKEDVQAKLLNVAQKLLQYGADGIRLTDYGLSKSDNAFGQINALIEKIRNATATDEKIKQKSAAIFVEWKWSKVASSANFSDLLLTDGEKDIGQIFEHIQTSVKDSAESFKENSTTKPESILKSGDENSPRLDQIIPANVQKVISSIQLVQLFVPGPISVYYGEELGLLSTPSNKAPQRGSMRWDSSQASAGFSTNTTSYFYSNATRNANNVAFKDELADVDSQLNAFKNATEVRAKAGIEFTVVDVGTIHYYARTSDDQKVPTFVLAINWPANANSSVVDEAIDVKIPQKFTLNRTLTKVEIKAHSSSIRKFPEFINLETENLQLNNYEAVLLELNSK